MNNLDVIQSRLDQAMAAVEPKVQRFTFLTADQLRELPPLAWRVQGVLPTTGLATVFGASGTGKSFLLLDLMAAVAEGREWYGRKTEPCRILCIVLEGQAGFVQRIRAWEKHNGRSYPEKVSFMMDRFGLNAKSDVVDLEAAIQAANGFDMIVIDTLNRAAPNADENSSSAMSQLVSAAGQLQDAVSGLVILVHHTGKDESRGLRGHSSLYAAMDAAVEVKRNGEERGWRLLKSKDGKDGAEYPFKLIEVVLDGKDGSSSCVVAPGEGGAAAFNKDEAAKPLSQNQRAVLETVQAMVAEAREVLAASDPSPDIFVVKIAERAKDKVTGGAKHSALRIREALEWLEKNGYIFIDDDRVWLIAE